MFFKPEKVKTSLPDPGSQPWPMGDLLPKQAPPPELDSVKLHKAVDLAFSDPKGLTVALVVLYKGQIVAERYALGVNKDTLLEGFTIYRFVRD